MYNDSSITQLRIILNIFFLLVGTVPIYRYLPIDLFTHIFLPKYVGTLLEYSLRLLKYLLTHLKEWNLTTFLKRVT